MLHTAQKLSFVFMTNFFLFWSWKVLMSCFLSRTALNALATFDKKQRWTWWSVWPQCKV